MCKGILKYSSSFLPSTGDVSSLMSTMLRSGWARLSLIRLDTTGTNGANPPSLGFKNTCNVKVRQYEVYPV